MAKSSLAHPLIVLLLSAFGASFADAQAIPDGSYEGYFHSDVDMPFTLQVSDTEWAGTVTGNDGKAA